MGSSQAEKAASHKRIVDAAAARIRRDGVAGISVADLMQEAGLTHGGFYRHFDSREALVDEAVDAALAHGSRRATAAARLGGEEALSAIVDGYLSALHRDSPETGCAVAALPADVARGSNHARAAYARQVERYLALLVDLLDPEDPDATGDEAQLMLSAMVGAVSMARAVDDAALSDEILERTRRALLRRAALAD